MTISPQDQREELKGGKDELKRRIGKSGKNNREGWKEMKKKNLDETWGGEEWEIFKNLQKEKKNGDKNLNRKLIEGIKKKS